MSRKIDFIASTKVGDYLEPPKPSQKTVPKWYKDIPVTREKDFEFDGEGTVSNHTLKHCVPFYDALTSGYHIVLGTDIHIKEVDGVVQYNYPVTQSLSHRSGKPAIPITDEFHELEFTWRMIYLPKTPKGYSCLYTHPMNRLDLPFMTLSGIVDTDVFYHTPEGNLPFYLKKGFSGVIKKGTPIAHLLPFKRDNWTSSFQEFNQEEIERNHAFKRSVLEKFYRKFAYVKKIFK